MTEKDIHIEDEETLKTLRIRKTLGTPRKRIPCRQPRMKLPI